ncbi:hypothetical protein K1W54_30655 [Micromonospora sp. CPCC 205371]|nr:hypothetical protein [Micromonospora sp. CPCC 205371]
MSDLGLLVQLQARVMTFLADLPADQLLALAQGRLSLGVLDGQDTTTTVPAVAASLVTQATPPPASTAKPRSTRRPRKAAAGTEPFDPNVVIAKLRASETVDEAFALMAGLKLKSAELKAITRVLDIPYGKNMDDTVKSIVTITVGARNKNRALRQL